MKTLYLSLRNYVALFGGRIFASFWISIEIFPLCCLVREILSFSGVIVGCLMDQYNPCQRERERYSQTNL
jgi:ABC-type uncharacterized transport system permease subunit